MVIVTLRAPVAAVAATVTFTYMRSPSAGLALLMVTPVPETLSTGSFIEHTSKFSPRTFTVRYSVPCGSDGNLVIRGATRTFRARGTTHVAVPSRMVIVRQVVAAPLAIVKPTTTVPFARSVSVATVTPVPLNERLGNSANVGRLRVVVQSIAPSPTAHLAKMGW